MKREPKIHELCCWPEPFAAILDGRRTFELRRDDRGFGVGDLLRLREWDGGEYTGYEATALVTYVLRDVPVEWGEWGITLGDDTVAMSIRVVGYVIPGGGAPHAQG